MTDILTVATTDINKESGIKLDSITEKIFTALKSCYSVAECLEGLKCELKDDYEKKNERMYTLIREDF